METQQSDTHGQLYKAAATLTGVKHSFSDLSVTASGRSKRSNTLMSAYLSLRSRLRFPGTGVAEEG